MKPQHPSDVLVLKKTAPTEFGPLDYLFLYRTRAGLHYILSYNAEQEQIAYKPVQKEVDKLLMEASKHGHTIN